MNAVLQKFRVSVCYQTKRDRVVVSGDYRADTARAAEDALERKVLHGRPARRLVSIWSVPILPLPDPPLPTVQPGGGG